MEIKLITIIAVQLLCLIGVFAQEIPPDLTFWQNSKCAGELWNTSRTTNLSQFVPDWVVEAASVSVLGTWQIQFLKPDNSIFNTYYAGMPPKGTGCINKEEMLEENQKNFKFSNVRVFYDYQSKTSQLFFMTETNFQGTYYWVYQDLDDGFNQATITVKSFIHFSNDVWVAYESTGYRGEPTCFCPTKTLANGTVVLLPKEGEKRGKEVDMMIASVRRGTLEECDCLKSGNDDGDGGGDGNGGGGSSSVVSNCFFVIMLVFASIKLCFIL